MFVMQNLVRIDDLSGNKYDLRKVLEGNLEILSKGCFEEIFLEYRKCNNAMILGSFKI